MADRYGPEPGEWQQDRPQTHSWDEAPASWTETPSLATGLPEWDLLPPTEFVQRPRGRL